MKLLLLFLLLFGAACEAKHAPIRVVILDSGFTKAKHPNLKLCEKVAEFDFTGTGIEDHDSHGENITGIIEDRLKGLNYCVYVIKYWDPKITYSTAIHFRVLLKIHDLHPDIVNFSSGGEESKFFENMFIDDTVNQGTLWGCGSRQQPCKLG